MTDRKLNTCLLALTLIFALTFVFKTRSGSNSLLASPQEKSPSLHQEPVKPSTNTESKSQRSLTELYAACAKSFAAGDYPAALEAAKELCNEKPDEPRFQFLLGEIAFASGEMAASVAAFDQVIRLQPQSEPQLWQRGLALYYARRFEDGVKQFETHQTVNSQDVENAVWHLLCAARISDVEQARKNLIPIERDRRVPMAQIYEMFAGRMSKDDVLTAASRTSSPGTGGGNQVNLQRYYAHLYIGLCEEMLGDAKSSLESLTKAVEINPLPKDNFMGNVAKVHVQLRKQEHQ